MKNSLFSLLIAIGFLFVSCSDDGNPVSPTNDGTKITQFVFLQVHNPSLNSNSTMFIDGGEITGRLPIEAVMENLVPTFKHDGEAIFVNNQEQINGVTENDFSNIVSYKVTSSSGDSEEYQVDIDRFTGLPIVYINTDGNAPIDSKEEYREGSVHIDGNYEFFDLASSEMKIRGRGNSTWGIHPKKPYQLKFSEKTEMLGMPQDKKWIFLAEFSDKTLIRNKISFELGHLSRLDYTPQSVYAEVFVNNEYNGTYNITQKVEESDNRVALGDTGYLLEIDQLYRLDPDDVFFRTNNFLINIKEPGLDYDSFEYNYVKTLLNEFETVLHSDNFADPVNGYAKYIDLDSFIDWYLISEIVKNQDSKDYSSIFLNVMPGEKIKMGPLWDFDLAFGNVDYTDAQYPEGFWIKDHAWYSRLFEDPAFVELVKERFKYYRSNETYILEKIDFYADQLRWAQQENDDKWDLIGNHVWPNPVVYDTYAAEVKHLKNWITTRMNWLDSAYDEL